MFKGFSRRQSFNNTPNGNFGIPGLIDFYGYKPFLILDAEVSPTNTKVDLQAINSMVDLAQGREFIQNTAASQPRFVLNDANFNNLPSIDFFSTSRNLSIKGSPLGLTKEATYIVVGKLNALNTSNIVFGTTSTSINFGLALGSGSTFNSVNGFIYGNGATRGETTQVNLLPKIFIFNFDCLVINGVSYSISSISATATELNLISQPMGIFGSARPDPGNGFNGQCALFAIIEHKLSTSEAIDLSNQINTRYGVY